MTALRWTNLAPPLALLGLLIGWFTHPVGPAAAVLGAVLIVAVLAAVHHAEVIAHRIGEPFGSVVLALAVTVIEVGLILMTMSGPQAQPTLGRDTIFAAVMITVNGIAGISLFIAAGSRGHARFREGSSGAMLASIAAISTLTMVVPNFTSAPGPTFTGPQLAFAAVTSLGLWLLFITTQTTTHRDYFLPLGHDGEPLKSSDHAEPPTNAQTGASVGLLLASLVSVVVLAKVETPALEGLLTAAGLPLALVGVLIALLVLAPETLSAIRAARKGRVQTSMNLAYGSAMAPIGLTIPALALASTWLPTPLALGLSPLHIALLVLTLFAATLTVATGRATRLHAGVHLAILAAYVFLVAAP